MKGQIILPTGTGKTQIQIALILKDMAKKNRKKETGVYCIAAHRILLCRQLLERLLKEATKCGINFDVLSVGSNRLDGDNEVYTDWAAGRCQLTCRIKSTTDPKDVKSFINSAVHGRHVIIVSTYHSIHALYSLPRNIDLLLCDEAHTTTSKIFNSSLKKLLDKAARVRYFTATPKVRGLKQGVKGGMYDETTYGKILHSETLREMVDRMEIIPPKLHYVHRSGGSTTSLLVLVRAICSGFLFHKEKVAKRAKAGTNGKELLGAKLLVSCNGIQQAKDIFNQHDFRQFCKNQGVRVFLFSSSGYGYGDKPNGFVQDHTIQRKPLYEDMTSMGLHEDAIILHINILTEGIDVPAITGVLPLRKLETISLLQTCGRASRLDRRDRERLYALNKLRPLDRKTDKDIMVKPYYNLILLSNVIEGFDDKFMAELIKSILNAYEIPLEELLEEDGFVGCEDSIPEVITGQQTDSLPKKLRGVFKDFDQWEEDIQIDLLRNTPMDRKDLMKVLDKET